MQLTFKTPELRNLCEGFHETIFNFENQSVELIKVLLLDIEAIEDFGTLKQYFHFWGVSINFDTSIITIEITKNCIIKLEFQRLKKTSAEITGIKIISINNG